MIFHKDLNFPKEHDKALDIYTPVLYPQGKNQSL